MVQSIIINICSVSDKLQVTVTWQGTFSTFVNAVIFEDLCLSICLVVNLVVKLSFDLNTTNDIKE